MSQLRALRDLIGAKTADYRTLSAQAKRSAAEMIDVNLARMPLLLCYFSIAFGVNLILYDWIGGETIAPHDLVFSGITLVFWVLFLGCRFGIIKSNKARKWIAGGFWIVSDLYLFIFIGMDIMTEHTVYNYLLGMFIIAILPLLSPAQSLLTVAANMIFAIVLVNLSNQGIMLVQFIVGSSFFAVIISWKEYYSFLRIQSVHSRLRELSERDKLTGLYNRNILESHVAVLWNACVKGKQPLIAAMLDIDYFKNYNDTFGHLLGDRCLEKVADCIVQAAPSELTMRYGGEEFVIFFTEVDIERVLRVLTDVQARIKALALDAGTGSIYPKLTISIGIAQMRPDPQTTVDDLINAADQQLYRAKESGRNCICQPAHLSPPA